MGSRNTAESGRPAGGAKAYLDFLYTPAAQEIIGQNWYRPVNQAAAAKFSSTFPKIELFTIDQVFGGWKKAQKVHFDDGGVFDQIYRR